MKICLYSSSFLPHLGGLETCSANLAQAWTTLGHDVLVVTDTPAPPTAPDFDRQFAYRVARGPDDGQWRQLLGDRHVIVSNGVALKQERHFRGAGIPFGWIHVAIFQPAGLGWLEYIKQGLRRRGTHRADFNICVSRHIQRDLGDPRAVVIYNAAPPIFRPLPVTQRSDHFLYYGRIWMKKGIDTILQALSILRKEGRDCHVDFVGSGADEAAALALAKNLGVEELAHFLKPQWNQQLVETINAARTVIVPSRYGEAFGMTALESLTCGQCAIVSRDGGLPEVVGNAALVFPPGDAPALAAHMRRLVENPPLADDYRRLALQRAGDFTMDRMAAQYISLFEAAISSGAARR